MNIGQNFEQDLNISVQQKESIYTPQEDPYSKIPGARINPSKIEPLSEIFSKYQEDIPITKILEKQSLNMDAAEQNAKSAVYGTLVHYLKYFTDIFTTTKTLGRIPNEMDFRSIFINKKDEYYNALLKIMDQTVENGLSNNPVLNGYLFWDTWRKNGQDYTPKKHKNFLISPKKIQYFYENHTIPETEIKLFMTAQEEEIIEDIIFKPNETFILMNLYFPECNLQIPTYIDQIEIDRDTSKPIKIIDYKTGKQFKEPEFREKVQIFLMTLAVFTTFIDRTNDIDYSISDWDIIHSEKTMPLPRLKENSRLFKRGFIGSLHSENIIEMVDIIKNNIKFSYINPIIHEEIEIDLNHAFLENTSEAKKILAYLNRLTNFYIQNKEILKYTLSGKNSPYALPIFPKEGFTNDSYSDSSVQLSLNV